MQKDQLWQDVVTRTEPRHRPECVPRDTVIYHLRTPSQSALNGGILFFFFQAEDGIRDFHVTGVQTCALPILKALRSHGLQVVSIHHHMIELQPMVIFLHYWGTGPAEQLAAGFKAALDQLGSKKGR